LGPLQSEGGLKFFPFRLVSKAHRPSGTKKIFGALALTAGGGFLKKI